MKAFYHILGNTLFTAVTNFFVWFAVVFWMYLETGSVLTTAWSGAVFMLAMSFSSFWFGSLVDHHRKKRVIIVSSVASLFFYGAALILYSAVPPERYQSATEPVLWIIILLLLAGVIAGNIRNIALPTLVTMLVPENRRDKANGLSGIVMGISSMGAGFSSGFALAYLGMQWVLAIGVLFTIAAIAHMLTVRVPEEKIVHTEEKPKEIDVRGTITAIAAVPGLFALIFFTTFNNFLGGVFMALMDAYGLSLMSVEAWGTLWGFLSTGFILGGLYIAKRGLGKNPLRTLFAINITVWTSSILFPLQPSIWLLAAGIFIWVCLMPFIEATEHTIVQKVVPFERQGRVIGFAQSIETAASPVTSFVIGPIAQFIFIPFMTTGAGVGLIGDWFGVGPGRGMALVFITAGIIGLIVTLIAMRSRSYKLLTARYQAAPDAQVEQ